MLSLGNEFSSKKPHTEKNNRSDEDRKRNQLTQTLKILFDNYPDEHAQSSEKSPKIRLPIERFFSSTPIANNQCLPLVSRIRRFQSINKEVKNCECEENSSNTFVFQCHEENSRKRLSFSNLDISESNFYSSDIAKDMLKKDQECHEKENTLQVDLDCSNCSSWSVCTQNIVSNSSLHPESECKQGSRHVSIDEFIRARTEYLGSLSDEPLRERAYFGSDVNSPYPFPANETSLCTPVPQSKDNFLRDCFTNFCTSTKLAHSTTYKNLPLLPLFKNIPSNKHQPSIKKEILEEFCYSLGIQPHEIGEKNLLFDENCQWSDEKQNCSRQTYTLEETFSGLSVSNSSDEPKKGISKLFLENSIQVNETCKSVESYRKKSMLEQWIIEPQEMTLDACSNGGRVLLISNFWKDLKFKATFDGRVINVCPLSGILPAKGQVRLRVLLSRFIKKLNQNSEDTIKVTCGKSEKSILVKICKGQETKPSFQKRTYICF